MKIRFIKEYVAVDPVPTSGIIHRYRVGETKEITPYTAQWLIDNGFAEEVKESGWWKPKNGENYYFIDGDGTILYDKYKDTFYNKYRVSVGNCFKTYFAADRYRDYLEAIATVRQDEGVLTTHEAVKQCGNGNRVYCLMPPGIVRNSVSVVAPGGIYFKDTESAGASWDAHRKEWQTILNYDWSRE